MLLKRQILEKCIQIILCTPEFFQPAVQKIALDFFARNM
jgi:hypothetical protein